MTESLLNKPYWIIDILPERVPEAGAGQFFAVEQYYLRQPMVADLHRRFTDLLLKLNCYSGFRVCFPDTDQQVCNPEPELLVSWIMEGQRDLCILLPGEDALITLNRDDTWMTLYQPSETLLRRTERLASAAGLFVWKPDESGDKSAETENR